MTGHKIKYQGLIDDIKTILRFGIVGVLATLTHICVVVGLSFTTSLHPVTMNSLAFCLAFLVSAYGHMRFTFHFKGDRFPALVKFFIVALISLAISNFALYGFVKSSLVKVSIAQAIAIFIVPVFSFVASKFWAFSEK